MSIQIRNQNKFIHRKLKEREAIKGQGAIHCELYVIMEVNE